MHNSGETDRLVRFVQLAGQWSSQQKGSRVTGTPERFSLRKLVLEVAEHHRALAKRKEILINQTISPSDCQIYADEHELRIALENLLDNALKFSPRFEAVEVILSPTGENYEIRVQDEGPGVPEDQRSLIFERFVSIPRRTDPEEGERGNLSGASAGSGLGLSIARALVEKNGGTLECERPPEGHGALFVCRFRTEP